jgi:hypothetical protein
MLRLPQVPRRFLRARIGHVRALTRRYLAGGKAVSGARACSGAHIRPAGSAVTLTYAELREFRGRLQSLLNSSGIGR